MRREWLFLIATVIAFIIFIVLYIYFVIGSVRTELLAADQLLTSGEQVLEKICSAVTGTGSDNVLGLIVPQATIDYCTKIHE